MKRVVKSILLGISLSLLFGLACSTSSAQGSELLEQDDAPSLQGSLYPEPLFGKKEKDPFEGLEDKQYRYDFKERQLSFGLDLGGGLANGIVMGAFPYGGVVTPYFRGGFGDNNALELDVSVGFSPLSAQQAYWLFFRSPVLAGSAAGGYVLTIAPNLAFRYEVEVSPSISKRSRILTFGGIGIGPTITYGSAVLIDNGGLPDTNLSNLEIFFDIVPVAGLRFRLGEFGFAQLGARLHIMLPVVANIDNAGWEFGRPASIPEFWIDSTRFLDVFLGFGYDFG